MRDVTVGLCVIAVLLLAFLAPVFAGDSQCGYSPEMQPKIDGLKKELKKYTDDKRRKDDGTA